MSSKYGRRSKIQPTPKFCYHKGTYRPSEIPCPQGPSIGQQPYVALQIKRPSPAANDVLVCGRLFKVAPNDPVYAGNIIGPDGSVWICDFNFSCEQQIFSWAAATTDPRWPAGPWTQPRVEDYHGGKNLDTGWLPAVPPGTAIGYTGQYRVYL